MLDFEEALDEVMLKQQQHISTDDALVAYQDAVDELQALYPDALASDCHDCIQCEVPRVWALARQARGVK
jgi:hypothetical protein